MKKMGEDCYMADDESIALVNVIHRNTKQNTWIVLNKRGDLLYGPDEDLESGILFMKLMEKKSPFDVDLNR